ncbi:LppU family putative lipoprotein [Nocardia camponoti]|uniref:LppU family putative lipoprotein n=1 Tax=Nocardia camponoti TaxID=1616106 RepID=UPI0016665735|nr:hypothetical protein [Nocardia camponoti]
MYADSSLGRFVGALAITVTALVATGCGGTVEGRAQPALDVVPATTASKAPTTSKPKPTTSRVQPTKQGGKTDFQANVGDCVNLGGTPENATIEKASCGSRSSNYKVIGKAKTSSACISDADQYYYETLDNVETGAICLDIDWVIGGCMDMSGTVVAVRMECNATSTKGVKVVSIEKNATDVDACPVADTGYIYDQRHIVVCTTDV